MQSVIISAISADVLAVRHSSATGMHFQREIRLAINLHAVVGEGATRHAYYLICLQRRLFNPSFQANGLASAGAGQGRTERIRYGRVDINTRCHPEILRGTRDLVQKFRIEERSNGGYLQWRYPDGTIIAPTAC